MFFELLGFLLGAIGFGLVMFAIGYAGLWLAEKIKDAATRREQRINRLIAALERIEVNTRKPVQP